MKKSLLTIYILLISLMFVNHINAQRQDAIWARMFSEGAVTLDGMLDEDVWAKAESLKITYGWEGLPTSGSRPEFQGDTIVDPTDATVKFLVSDANYLYLAFDMNDVSIGGTTDWARWDAILMSLKNLNQSSRPAGAAEYFYTYWLEGLPDSIKLNPQPGASPRFVGKYGDWAGTGRTDGQIDAWNAVTKIYGTSNDNQPDEKWVVEMRISLDSLGYDVTKEGGDVVGLNFSIWDCDFVFNGDPNIINTSRTHWQSPWGNANANNVGRVMGHPSVTVSTTSLPEFEYDVVIPNAGNKTLPSIDGVLDEEVWEGAYSFDISFGDATLRESYPGVGKFMSGEYQPELNGLKAPVLDPGKATIKMFFKDNYLYLAADVEDQVVQGQEQYDKYDGVAFNIASRKPIYGVEPIVEYPVSYNMLRLGWGFDGTVHTYDFLTSLVDSGYAEFASELKGASTVNENSDVDEGYSFELKLDLTGLNYPTDLGDKDLFFGVQFGDGDSFEDSLSNYGTRTWWFREHAGGPAFAWAKLDPNFLVDVDDEVSTTVPNTIRLYGNYPNPFNPVTKIKYGIPEAGSLSLKVFNLLGEEVVSKNLGIVSAGLGEYSFDASNLSTGVYFYKVILNNSVSSNKFESKVGKMLLIK